MDQMLEKLSLLIKDPELEKLELTIRKPNFFTLLKIEGMEIRHSHFLAWLLDPNGTHNLGNIYLRWFLRDIFSDHKVEWASEFSIDNFKLTDVKVLREWNYIDILIVTNDFVICIENKVWSKEHSDQLTRYRTTITNNFPDRNHAFVFLNPAGILPENIDDASTYIVYTYEQIKKNLDIIFDVYSDALSERVKIYLEDYNTILRRDMMKQHESIDIAKLVYKNHREALDFIFKHAQEEMQDLTAIVSQAVLEKGYVLGTINPNKVRFLTPRLNNIIPRTGNYFRERESFVFEFIINKDKVYFKTPISPGNEHNRKALKDALCRVGGARIRNSNSIWVVPFSIPTTKELTENELSEEEIKSFVYQLLEQHKSLIENIEREIIIEKDNFI